jgi:hypothetical protein
MRFFRKEATPFFYAFAIPGNPFHYVVFFVFLPLLIGGGESSFPCSSPFLPGLLTRFSLPFLVLLPFPDKDNLLGFLGTLL